MLMKIWKLQLENSTKLSNAYKEEAAAAMKVREEIEVKISKVMQSVADEQAAELRTRGKLVSHIKHLENHLNSQEQEIEELKHRVVVEKSKAVNMNPSEVLHIQEVTAPANLMQH